MNGFDERSDRRIVPRWRKSTEAAASQELLPVREQTAFEVVDSSLEISNRRRDFEIEPSVGTAANLLGTAMVGGAKPEAELAALFIRNHDDEIPAPLKAMAISVLNGKPIVQQESETTLQLAKLRQLIQTNPRSAALWVDMARCHAIIGQDEKAERNMKVALQLAPQSRWVLRSAARLLLHTGHKEDAHTLLVRSPMTPHDPWLMSAEVATAQIIGRDPKFWKKARNIVKSASIRPLHLSELASAIATMELAAGNTKNAKKLFKQSLVEPTENAVAQVKWSEGFIKDTFEINSIVKTLPNAFEADFWQKYMDGQMGDSMVAVGKWLDDEPFSIRPVIMKSHVASLMDDYDSAIRTMDEFQAYTGADLSLTNNRVFAEISMGEIFSGDTEVVNQNIERLSSYIFGRIRVRESDLTQNLANLGLLYYRLGMLDDGRDFYDLAIENASNVKDTRQAANASMYHAREAVIAEAPWAGEVVRLASERVKAAKNQPLEFYFRKVEAVAKSPGRVLEVFHPANARKFEKVKHVAMNFRVERTATGDIIWLPPRHKKYKVE